MENFVVEDKSFGLYGKRVAVTSYWDDEIIDYMQANNIRELILNYVWGWKGEDISFLQKMNFLEAFDIVDWQINDISPIQHLSSLRHLGFSTSCKTKIDYSSFPLLEDCNIMWRRGSETISKCLKLNRLSFGSYTPKDTSVLATLSKLKRLTISNGPVNDLVGISNLTDLRLLSLNNLRKLQSLSAISKLTNLEELEIYGCKFLGNIDSIAGLKRLRKLLLINDGKIESLKPIENLDELEWLLFYDDTDIISGDLSPILKLKRLNNLAFHNRKHYSHKYLELCNIMEVKP